MFTVWSLPLRLSLMLEDRGSQPYFHIPSITPKILSKLKKHSTNPVMHIAFAIVTFQYIKNPFRGMPGAPADYA